MKEILVFQYQNIISINLFQVVEIVLAALFFWLVYRVMRNRVLPWYFGMDGTSSKNFDRSLRVLRLVLFSFFVVLVLRVFNLDYPLIRESLLTADELKKFEMENPDAANDRPLEFIVRVSTLIKALLAFVVANLLDLIIGEVVTQRFYRKQVRAKLQGTSSPAGVGLPDRIKWLKPFLYLVAIILVANDTGIVYYTFFDLPQGKDGTAIPFTVGKLLNAAFVFTLVGLLVSFTTSFLLKGYYTKTKIDTGSQFAINRLVTYFAYFLGVLLVIQAAGFNLVVIWTGAAALLVGVGIGLQQTFNDLICGVIILFERSVKVGDVLELSGHEVGTVRKIGARTSVMETRDDIIIFVPNSKLIGENVTNWSQIERRARFNIGVGVAYGSDTLLVKEILEEVADAHTAVLQSPKPFVRFTDFGDSSLDFQLFFWSRDFIRIENVKSDLRFAVDNAFRARGIEIPFPQRDLWIKGGLPKFYGEQAPAKGKTNGPPESAES